MKMTHNLHNRGGIQMNESPMIVMPYKQHIYKMYLLKFPRNFKQSQWETKDSMHTPHNDSFKKS